MKTMTKVEIILAEKWPLIQCSVSNLSKIETAATVAPSVVKTKNLFGSVFIRLWEFRAKASFFQLMTQFTSSFFSLSKPGTFR